MNHSSTLFSLRMLLKPFCRFPFLKLLTGTPFYGTRVAKEPIRSKRPMLSVTRALLRHHRLLCRSTGGIIWRMSPSQSLSFCLEVMSELYFDSLSSSSKGCCCSHMCKVCGGGEESTWHAFVTCLRSQLSWKQSDFWHVIEQCILHATGIHDLFFSITHRINTDMVSRFVMLQWSIWVGRNAKVCNSLHAWNCQSDPVPCNGGLGRTEAGPMWEQWALAFLVASMLQQVIIGLHPYLGS